MMIATATAAFPAGKNSILPSSIPIGVGDGRTGLERSSKLVGTGPRSVNRNPNMEVITSGTPGMMDH